ncbi:MAG: Rieske (2Fe-2S) protein, partial [Anaerolineae bacterium]|nr:Rieske (2Fe-2S) protein [Anaerolineae bacterium]
PALLNRQQQVNQAADSVARYLFHDGQPDQLLAMLGKLLLREDRDFHTIQTVEGAFKQYTHRRGTVDGAHALIAAARYLAAHAPTVRAQEQTFSIAQRLHRGERLFEG